MKEKIGVLIVPLVILVLAVGLVTGCKQNPDAPQPLAVPQENTWGIYKLDIETQKTIIVYSFPPDVVPGNLCLNDDGDRFVLTQKTNGTSDNYTEIYTIGTDGMELTRLTDNDYWDLYPVWSPDGRRIAFLSWRDKDLDIYVMDADGKNEVKLFDSGDHDADIDWTEDNIVFTSRYAIWIIKDNGTQAEQVTAYPEMGEWGIANLPKGDYDPRSSPDGHTIAFERLENNGIPNGGYNIFTVGREGKGEIRLTSSGYSQGLVNWAHSGEKLVYSVAAIDGRGKFDIYIMNPDGTGNHNVTPDYFPSNFLCHQPVFSQNDASIYFLGQWWENQ
jgi:Tol biopolymer transport system component